jgi:transcriptional regulator with XRE-family HTH domain
LTETVSDLGGGARSAASVDLATLLRSWRHRAQLTQEELAERAGLGVRTIRRYEGASPVRRGRQVSVRLLASALGLDARERSLLVRVATRPPQGPAADIAAVAEPRVPRQLPAAAMVFTGRDHELAQIMRAGDPAELAIVAIDGMAGVGKTALACEVAHRIAVRYPDGQIHLDLHGSAGMGPVEPGAALGRVLRSLGVPDERIPAELEDRAALYRGELAGQRVLVLLDDAVSEAQVAPLLPASPGCLVLITSRRRLSGLNRTHALVLHPPSAADAAELLRRSAGADRLPVDSDESVAEIALQCGRLPVALRIAAARLHSHPSWTAEHLLRHLRDRRRGLAEFAAGSLSVSASFDASYHRLDPDSQHAYRVLGLHPDDEFDLDAGAALIGRPGVQAARLIDHLVEVHLLEELAANRYRFHELVRRHAADRVEQDSTDAERCAAVDRLVEHRPSAAGPQSQRRPAGGPGVGRGP